MFRTIVIFTMFGSGLAVATVVAAPYVFPNMVSAIDSLSWEATYKKSFIRYHFYARLPDGHLLLDERGEGLRFESRVAADTYAADYAALDRQTPK